jgi:hypothetical protein
MKTSVSRFLLANIYFAAAFCAKNGIGSATLIVCAAVWLVAAFLAEDRRAQAKPS